VAEDVESADLSQVSGTPTFFINDRRHYGVYDLDTLAKEVRGARARAEVARSALSNGPPAPDTDAERGDAPADTAPAPGDAVPDAETSA
jgi:hypothetical protein